MKKILIVLMCLLLPMNFAGAEEKNLEDANENLICALSSMAAYSGDDGFFVRKILTSRGFTINRLLPDNGSTNVKAYLIDKEFPDGRKMKIFVVAGTEDMKDAEVDAKIGRTALHDGEEFQNDPHKIFVHKGFRDYADNALSEGVTEFLIDELNNNPNETLYLTGHSLGGAVAMMIAVRLTDAGANMNNVKVLTFGAPAVGNKDFAEKFKDKIHLTRAVMDSDIVDVSLDVFGYTHFGEVVAYKQVESSTQYAHAISLYLDCAIRKFYDAELKIHSQEKIKIPVYIAPIKIVNKSFKPFDEKYIKEVLIDGYASRFTKITFAEPNFETIKKSADFSYSVKDHIDAAQKSGSKFIIVPLIHTKPVRDAKQNTVRILLEEIIFDANGHLKTMNTSGMTSTDVTILDAAFWGQEFLRESRENTVTSK